MPKAKRKRSFRDENQKQKKKTVTLTRSRGSGRDDTERHTHTQREREREREMRASAYRFSGRGRRLAARCSATEPASSGTGGDEKKVRSRIPKAPARSVRAHLQGVPLDHIAKVPKAGAGLASDGTQTAHGLNYHHAQNAGGEGYYFYMPTVSLMGPGALKKAVRDMGGRGLGKVLVVTDRVLREIGALSSLTDLLDEHGIAYEVFDEITPNPTSAQVMAGVEAVERLGCEGVVSFGGGSPHDCAKGIALVCANGGHIKDYEGENKSAKKMLPMVAVNTTAGTASEMTRFCIVTDEERHVKMAIVDWHVTPDVAVDDPELMVGMPPGLTAATGMDALTHAIEAYVSTASTPITDACALHAIKLISRYLRTAVRDGEDLQARDMMSYAEFLAGMAFNSASLGYVHVSFLFLLFPLTAPPPLTPSDSPSFFALNPRRWPTSWAGFTTSLTACAMPCCSLSCSSRTRSTSPTCSWTWPRRWG